MEVLLVVAIRQLLGIGIGTDVFACGVWIGVLDGAN